MDLTNNFVTFLKFETGARYQFAPLQTTTHHPLFSQRGSSTEYPSPFGKIPALADGDLQAGQNRMKDL